MEAPGRIPGVLHPKKSRLHELGRRYRAVTMIIPRRLFREGYLSATLDDLTRRVPQVVASIQADQFLASPVEILVKHVADQVSIEPLEIYLDRIVQQHQEVNVDVAGSYDRGTDGMASCLIPGIRVTVSIPFTGEPSLWDLQPSTSSTTPSFGNVVGNQLHIIIEQPLDLPVEPIKGELDNNLNQIRRELNYQKQQVVGFQQMLPTTIRAAINARKEGLGKRDKLAALLNIPLRHDPNAPTLRPIPVQRRIITPLPPVPKSGVNEWTIGEAEYENILTIIRHQGRTFESTPQTFGVHDEEGLRDIIVANLNGYYKGDASGETFRRVGKTDIRIEAENRAAFVAECKVWKGRKTIAECVDQLLSYLTWRDCKTAIVIFNKDVAGFSDILARTKPAIEAHPKILKMVQATDHGEWKVVFRSQDDDARLVHVQFFLFNLFVPSKKKD